MPVKTAMRAAEFSAHLFVGITNGLKIQPVNKPQDRFLNFEETPHLHSLTSFMRLNCNKGRVPNFEQTVDRQSPLGFLVFSKKLLVCCSF